MALVHEQPAAGAHAQPAADRSDGPADVSFIITNYNTGPYLPRCIGSLLSQDLAGLCAEVLVVENASPKDQTRHLDAARSLGANILQLERNHGHGGGCNRGLAATSGRFVAFVNSDVVACPGAVLPMLRYLAEQERAGLVEPRTFLDDDRELLIPEIVPPTPVQLTAAALGRMSARAAAMLSRRRTRRCLTGWRATAPLEQANLTGSFLVGRRAVLTRFGPYDEGYPLFYEDTDLFARMRRAGFRLLLMPQCHVIHYGHRSVATMWEEAIQKSRIGRARYLTRFHGRIAHWLDQALEGLCRTANRLHAPRPAPRVELGLIAEPPPLAWDAGGPFLLELAFDPFFALAAGCLGQGTCHRFSAATWRSLFPTTYYVRVLDPMTLQCHGAWTFEKAPGEPA